MEGTGLFGLFSWIALIYILIRSLGTALRQEKEIGIPLAPIGRAFFVNYAGFFSVLFSITPILNLCIF